ncbi:MAG: hypothetical protein IKK15_00570 [Akkermansia sp.]|nr:hypothetical protein [Akkermansia sp.]
MHAIAICLSVLQLHAVEVEVEGKSDGQMPAARLQALTEALNEAVRTGAGVVLQGDNAKERKNYDFDRSFSQAGVYIKKYQIVHSGLNPEGFYIVRIKADVRETPTEADDLNLFSYLAREYGAPRVVIDIKEQVEGVTNCSIAADWLRDTATRCGLQVVDVMYAQGSAGTAAKRAEKLGRKTEAELRSNGVVSSCDYIIEGAVVGAVSPSVSYYGSKPVKKYSLGLDITVRDAATGIIMLTQNSPSRDIAISGISSDTAAVREAVRLLMEGDGALPDSDYGWQLMRRIFSHWATEHELGATFRMEFVGLNVSSADMLVWALRQHKNVSAIWVQSIDAQGISVVDCESRLAPEKLAEAVESALPGCKLDRSDKRYLYFRHGNIEKVKENSAETVIVQEHDSGVMTMWWEVAGSLIASTIGGVFVFAKKRRAKIFGAFARAFCAVTGKGKK